MLKSSPIHALVVGAGPVGLFAALQLSQAGCSVRVIERGFVQNTESYALALHPGVLTQMEEAGLLDAVLGAGRRVHRVRFGGPSDLRGSVDLAQLAVRWPFALVLPQSALESILAAALNARGVRVEWCRELTSFEQSADGVVARVAHLSERPQGYATSGMRMMEVAEEVIPARFLIGADGTRSTVRSQLGIPMQYGGPMRHFALFEFQSEAFLDDDMHAVFAPQGSAVLWPMASGRARWTFSVSDPVGNPGVDLLESLLRERVPFFPIPRSVRWGVGLSVRQGMAQAFGKGRCWLAGDAAHQALPAGIQSMNGGLWEATLLAQCIANVDLRAHPEEAFVAYNENRLREWRGILGLPQENGDAKDHETPAARDFAAPHDPWLLEHQQELIASIPATGLNLRVLYEHLVHQHA